MAPFQRTEAIAAAEAARIISERLTASGEGFSAREFERTKVTHSGSVLVPSAIVLVTCLTAVPTTAIVARHLPGITWLLPLVAIAFFAAVISVLCAEEDSAVVIDSGTRRLTVYRGPDRVFAELLAQNLRAAATEMQPHPSA